MKLLPKFKHSLITRLVIPLLILIIIEGIIFSSFINFGGTREYIKKNSYANFEEQLGYQVVEIQKNMVLNWANITNHTKIVDSTLKDIALKNNVDFDTLIKEPQKNEAVMNEMSAIVLDLMRKNAVTGAYIIFNDEENENFPSLYYRDFDPKSTPSDFSDVLVEVSPVDLAKESGLTLNHNWDSTLKLNTLENTSFYYNPFLAATNEEIVNSITEPSDLGYWSTPFNYNGWDVITYSMPLIDSNTKKPYGVLGIELSLEYLKEYLPYENLGGNKAGAYSIAGSNKNSNLYYLFLNVGPKLESHMQNSTHIKLHPSNINDELYEITFKDNPETIIYSAKQEIKLYNQSSPFKDEKWYLISMMEKNDLFFFATTLTNSLYLALLLSLLIGIIGTLLISFSFVYPIKQFVSKVKKSTIDKPLVFEKTKIFEIDELSNSIEDLNRNILDNSAKLSQILALSNLSIGAFEFNPVTEKVFCTDVMFKFLSLNKSVSNFGYIDKDLFLKKLSIIISELTPNINQVFELKANNRVSWVKVKTIDNNGKILGIVVDVTNETAEKIKIEHERDHDSMTHLYNRRAFLSLLSERVNKEKNPSVGALIMCDLDNLKRTNDTYGHAFGDKYIRAAADALSFFNQYNGIVARMSGDEFFAFIDGFKTKDECRKVISKFMVLFKNAYIHIDHDTVIPLNASCGIAWYPDDSDNYTTLIKYADFAMYEVKKNHKNDYKEFEIEAYKNSADLIRSKKDLKKLIKNNLFKYAFQPIVSAKTGEVYAYEALMRPALPSLKSPADVLELATLQNCLGDIERLTWLNTLDIYSKNKDKFLDAKIFINSIPNQVMNSSDTEYIDTVFAKEMPNVVIEIIESEKCKDNIINQKKEHIQSLGGLIALDDFGSGYSNTIALLKLEPDLIKMDMDLIRNIDVDINRQALVQNAIAYAQERDIKIVAEGVETEDELRTVIRFGVDYIQGYFVCKPDYDIPRPPQDKIDVILRLNKELEDNR